MQRKIKVHSRVGLRILVIAALLVLSSAARAGAPGIPIKEQLRSKTKANLRKAKQTVLKDRAKLVGELMSILKDKLLTRDNVPATVNAIELLGEIRALEAAPLLFDMIRYRRYTGLKTPATVSRPITDTIELEEMAKDFPCVKALAQIGVPSKDILSRIPKAASIQHLQAYTSVLLGSEGPDVTVAILKKAIETASVDRDKEALGAALKAVMRTIKKEK